MEKMKKISFNNVTFHFLTEADGLIIHTNETGAEKLKSMIGYNINIILNGFMFIGYLLLREIVPIGSDYKIKINLSKV